VMQFVLFIYEYDSSREVVLDSTYMQGYASLYLFIESEIDKPVRRYSLGPVSRITPIAQRCFRIRADEI
jgi:hypothetical protein